MCFYSLWWKKQNNFDDNHNSKMLLYLYLYEIVCLSWMNNVHKMYV